MLCWCASPHAIRKVLHQRVSRNFLDLMKKVLFSFIFFLAVTNLVGIDHFAPPF